jgi:hypothetical protein
MSYVLVTNGRHGDFNEVSVGNGFAMRMSECRENACGMKKGAFQRIRSVPPPTRIPSWRFTLTPKSGRDEGGLDIFRGIL